MVIRRRNRQTGTYITIGRSADLGLDPNGGWLTICDKHDFIIGHDTSRMAIWHSPDPLGWCDGCQEEVREKEAWEEAKRHRWN